MKKFLMFLVLSVMFIMTGVSAEKLNDRNGDLTLKPLHQTELIVQDSLHQLQVCPDVVEVMKDSLQVTTTSLEIARVRTSQLQEFKELVLGGLTPATYWAGFLFCFIGMFIRWGIKTRKSVKNNLTTPSKFKFWFWVKDNLKDKILQALFVFAVIFICLRFPYELLGWTFSMVMCLGVGLLFDWVVDMIDNWKPIRKIDANAKI